MTFSRCVLGCAAILMITEAIGVRGIAQGLGEKENSRALQPKDEEQTVRLKFGDSDVVVYASELLSDQRLIAVSQTVQREIAQNHGGAACSCFCYAFPVSSTNRSIPTMQTQCQCIEKDGVKAAKPKVEGVKQVHQPFNASRYRYTYPRDSAFSRPTYGLMLSLDAGDSQSLNTSEPEVWNDVSGMFRGKVELVGGVGIQEDVGGGSLKFGPADGARAIVRGLDISPSRFTDLTIEMWIRLDSIANGRGWAVGNDNDGKMQSENATDIDKNETETIESRCGRTLVMHDAAFAPLGARAGATAMTADGAFISDLGAPPVEEWMHVVGVWQQGGFSYVYRNGARAVAASSTENADGWKDLFIGGHPTLSDHQIDGSVALVNVYARALSLKEVKSAFCFMAPRFKLSCPAGWKGKRGPLA